MSVDDWKRKAAEQGVRYVQDGQIVGLGTGSTAKHAVALLGEAVKGGLRIRGVPTSRATELQAIELGIPIVHLNDVEGVDVTIDGADEVDPGFRMIKGGGGALTREKLVGQASTLRVILVDETKLVDMLGTRFPVPVEVVPFGWRLAERRLAELGAVPSLRLAGDRAFETDNGNYIIDCSFTRIDDPADLEKRIKLLPAVVENGLFIGLADVLVVGKDDGVESIEAGR